MLVESHQAHVRRRFAGLVLSSLLGVAACSADDASGTATPSPVSTVAPEATPAVETDRASRRHRRAAGRHLRAAGHHDRTLGRGRPASTGDDFYAVPEPLPAGEPGTLLRYEPIDVFGGWSNFGDSPGEFGLQTMGTISGEVVIWRDPVAVRPERVDRPVPDEAVGRSAQELASWLAEHPELEATDPAARLGRRSGRVRGGDRHRADVDEHAGDVPVRGGVRGPVRATASRVRLAAGHPRRPRPDDPARHRRRRRHGAHRRRPLRPSRHRSGGVRLAGRAAAGQHRLHRRRARTGHRRVCARPRILPWPFAAGRGTRQPSSNHRSATRFPHARRAGQQRGG